MKEKTGEKEREHAEPAAEKKEADRGENQREDAPPAQKPEQSPEERRHQASLRRQRQEQERQAEVQRRVDEAYAAAFAGAGEPVRSEADYQRQQRLARELEAVTAINPQVKTMDDLAGMERAEAFFTLLQSNRALSLAQAYILTCYDDLAADQARRAAKAAAGKLVDKRHLQPMPGRGNGDTAIPPGTLEMYRALFPGRSDAEFARHWKRSNQSGG